MKKSQSYLPIMVSTLTDIAKANLQPIGKYVHLVDERNSDLGISNLVGLTIEKRYIASVANIIGTDLSKYKIIRKGRFACSLMQVSRDKKMPVAMYDNDEPAIISPAYPMFEVNDDEELMPEYLNMYLMREEFDREAVFYAVGGVRGSLEWDDFMAMQMPIPDINEQRRVVAEYKAIEKRIDNNNRLIKKLEETAQAIYYHTFVENIDSEDLPKGWKIGIVHDFGKVVTGKTPSTDDVDNYGGDIPFVTIPDMHDFPFAFSTERTLSLKGANTQRSKTLPENAVCVSCIGTSGLVVITVKECQTNQQINSIIPHNIESLYYIYLVMTNLKKIIAEYGLGGAVLNNLSKGEFEKLNVLIPSTDTLKKFNNSVKYIFENIKVLMKENISLNELRSLLIAKLS